MTEYHDASEIEKRKRTLDLEIDVLIRCTVCGNTKTARNYHIGSYDRLICSACKSKSPEIILPIRLEFHGQVGHPDRPKWNATLAIEHRDRIKRAYVEKADLVLKCTKCAAKPETLKGFPLWLFDELVCRDCGASGRQFRLASMKRRDRSFQISRFLKSSLEEIIENRRQPKIESPIPRYLDRKRSIAEANEYSFMEIKRIGSREERDSLLEHFSSPGILDEKNFVHVRMQQKLTAWLEGSLHLAALTAQVQISTYLTLTSPKYRCKLCRSQAFSIEGSWRNLDSFLGNAASFTMTKAMFDWNENLMCPSCFEEHSQDFLKSKYSDYKYLEVDEYVEDYQYNPERRDVDSLREVGSLYGYTVHEFYDDLDRHVPSRVDGEFKDWSWRPKYSD